MAFSTSVSGLSGAQTELATLANNIANVGTRAFSDLSESKGDSQRP
jgi:flagellar hook protein FlgE